MKLSEFVKETLIAVSKSAGAGGSKEPVDVHFDVNVDCRGVVVSVGEHVSARLTFSVPIQVQNQKGD